MFSPVPSEAIPASHPPCHLCRRTRPLPTFNLTTLDPLPTEIRSIILDFIVSTPCRSVMVKLLSTSSQLYEQIAPQLYRSVVLDEQTAQGFYYGLGKKFGGTDQEMEEDHQAYDAVEARKAAIKHGLYDPLESPPLGLSASPKPPRPWTEAEAKVVFHRLVEPPTTASPFLRQPLRKLALLALVRELNVGDVVGMQLGGEASSLYIELLKRPVLLETLQLKVYLNASSNMIQSAEGGAHLLEACLFRYLTSMVFTRPLMEKMHELATTSSSVPYEGLMESLRKLATSCTSPSLVLDVHLPDKFPHVLYSVDALPETVFVGHLRPGAIRLFNVHPCDILSLPFDTDRFALWLAPEGKRKCCASNKQSVVKQLCWCYGPNGVIMSQGENRPFTARSILYMGCNATKQQVEVEVAQQLRGNKYMWRDAL